MVLDQQLGPWNASLNGSFSESELPVVDTYDWSYALSPDIPPWIYMISAVYLFVIGAFGILSNGAIMIVFIRTPAVSMSIT